MSIIALNRCAKRIQSATVAVELSGTARYGATVQDIGTEIRALDDPHSRWVRALDQHFTTWWAAFLLTSLKTLKEFRRFGEGDAMVVALALAVEHLRLAERSSQASRPGDRNGAALSLSELAVKTGCPIETTRRTLAQMVQVGAVQRQGKHYCMATSAEFCAFGADQAKALMNLLGRIPVSTSSELLSENSAVTNQGISAVWCAVLRYSANLRRRITKGHYLRSLIAGMIQVEQQVRSHFLLHGKSVASRVEFNQVAVSMQQPLISIKQTAIIAGEELAKTQAAVRHAVDLGLGTVPESGIFRYSIGAAAVPDDSQAYTRGVKEALADLMLSSAPAGGKVESH
mgnify:CR=1 FL=1